MGWLFACVFAVVAGAILWRYGRLPRTGLELVAAAALLGVAGYAWQASPDQPGAPVPPRESMPGVEDVAAIATRRAMSGQFGTEAQTVEFADTLDRLGLTGEAVIAVKTGLRKSPNSVELWVALGNTLVAHGGGMASPAAQYAFEHAARLSPEHPAPPFFLGLAMAQSGRTEEAAQIWGALLARTPPDSPWRADLEARIASLGVAPPTQSNNIR